MAEKELSAQEFGQTAAREKKKIMGKITELFFDADAYGNYGL